MEEVTLSNFLIAFLCSGRSSSTFKKSLWEQAQKKRRLIRSVFNQNLYRLKKRGLVKIEDDRISVTDDGINYYNYTKLKCEPSGETRIICIFDIPESRKKAREWLRSQIILWGFKMIQRSVWIGKGPFPIEFKERLRHLGIEKCVKTFKVTKQVM